MYSQTDRTFLMANGYITYATKETKNMLSLHVGMGKKYNLHLHRVRWHLSQSDQLYIDFYDGFMSKFLLAVGSGKDQ
jgi:hypothetical protein